MLEQMIEFFLSGFIYPNITWLGLLWGIGLGVAFGAFWLATYLPPLFKKWWLWAFLPAGALLGWVSVAFIQIPLQFRTGQALGYFWSQETLIQWLLLAGIPQILLSGLVQEGAKLVPVVFWWYRKGKNVDPKMALLIGAIAGAGLGVFEAVRGHNIVFATGWRWEAVEAIGILAFMPFWERFFVVALHVSLTALAGYGLARGWGWQSYLVVAFLHSLTNYGVVLLQSGLLNPFQLEICVAIIASGITAVALWLRWKKPKEIVAATQAVIT